MVKGRLEKFWKKHPELKQFSVHVGKFIDRLDSNDVLDLVAAMTIAYGGFEAARKHNANFPTSLATAGTGVIAYQLAKAPNVIAGASGMSYIAALGLLNIYNPLAGSMGNIVQKSVEKAEDIPFPFGFGTGFEWPPKLRIKLG